MSEASSPELFFIIGSPRSGTTLLQSICMSARGVYVPPETHFLTRFPSHRALDTPERWEEALLEVEEVSRRDELPMKGFRAHEASAERTQSGLLRLWLESCGRSQGARWVGEASNVHTRDALHLAKLFPRAKIIHMIRDPRDVAVSQREAWGYSVTRASLRWRDELRVHQRASVALNPTRYRAVRYERLVSSPLREIKALCAWFGWPFQEEMLRPHLRSSSGFATREVHKLRSLQPITASRVGRWRETLTAREVMRVELFCGGVMDELGYERAERGVLELAQAGPALLSEVKEVALSYGSQLVHLGLEALKQREEELKRRAEAQRGLGEG